MCTPEKPGCSFLKNKKKHKKKTTKAEEKLYRILYTVFKQMLYRHSKHM